MKILFLSITNFPWMPFFRFIRDLINQGYVDRCYQCEFRFLMGYATKDLSLGMHHNAGQFNLEEAVNIQLSS